MAIDSRNKRLSMIGLGSPVPTQLPTPDGLTSASDRAMRIWLYFGIDLAPIEERSLLILNTVVDDILTFNTVVDDILTLNTKV